MLILLLVGALLYYNFVIIPPGCEPYATLDIEDDKITKMITDSQGNVIIAGDLYYVSSFPKLEVFDNAHIENPEYDGFIIKFDKDGNYLFSIILSESSNTQIKSIHLMENDDFVVTGLRGGRNELSFEDRPDRTEFISMYKQNGVLRWELDFQDADHRLQVLPVESLKLLVSVFINDTAFLIKLNSDGDTIWELEYSSENMRFDLYLTPDEEYLIIRKTGTTSFDVRLLLQMGIEQWHNNFGGVYSIYFIYSMTFIDDNGDFYFVGETWNEDLPGSEFSQTSFQGGWDIVIMKMSSSGFLVSTSYIGAEGVDQIEEISFNNHDQFFILGYTTITNASEEITYELGQFMISFNITDNSHSEHYLGLFSPDKMNIVSHINSEIVLVGSYAKSELNDFKHLDAMVNYTSNSSKDLYLMKFIGNVFEDFNAIPGDTEDTIVGTSLGSIVMTTHSKELPLINAFSDDFYGIEDFYLFSIDDELEFIWSTYFGNEPVEETFTVCYD